MRIDFAKSVSILYQRTSPKEELIVSITYVQLQQRNKLKDRGYQLMMFAKKNYIGY
jgi:hypothetical protein